MRKMPIFALSILASLLTLHAADPKPNADKKEPAASKEGKKSAANEVAVIKTTEGEMVLTFWPEVAPKTVENFKKLAKEKFYDGTSFHRILKGFMIQGGDPNTKDPAKEDSYGTGGPGYTVPAEFNDRSHQFGVISMARSNDPNSAGSQFFLCNGDASQLDHKYTAFGKLIKGETVLKKISDTPVVPDRRGEPSKPTKRVVIESIKIVPADSIKQVPE